MTGPKLGKLVEQKPDNSKPDTSPFPIKDLIYFCSFDSLIVEDTCHLLKRRTSSITHRGGMAEDIGVTLLNGMGEGQRTYSDDNLSAEGVFFVL